LWCLSESFFGRDGQEASEALLGKPVLSFNEHQHCVKVSSPARMAVLQIASCKTDKKKEYVNFSKEKKRKKHEVKKKIERKKIEKEIKSGKILKNFLIKAD